MKIETLVDRELTTEEIQSILTFRKYTDGVSFACLRSRVMVILEDATPTDLNAVKEQALHHMRGVLSVHPDFTVYDMDDGHVLVGMHYGLCAFSEHPCDSSMEVNFALRGECLDAAENMEIIAFAYEED